VRPAEEEVDALRRAATIRARAAAIHDYVARGESPHFTLDEAKLPAVAARVASLTRRRFPDLRVPPHSRWRHFAAGGVDRHTRIDAALGGVDCGQRARAHIELTVVSVLLDAGAGGEWAFVEPQLGGRYTRSEGLAVASLHAFLAGLFSSAAHEPCRVDADALRRLEPAALAHAFQVGPHNPLVGVDGRVALLRRLGDALAGQPERFGSEGRPGRLFDALSAGGTVDAEAILRFLLDAFSGIWPSGPWRDGVPLGDVWPHPVHGWVPFHKLSQWLTYSLLEPFACAGVEVRGADALTGLPEYRNGGLLIDAGVIVPRDAGFAKRTYTPADALVVEWRALTVHLLDAIAPLVREALDSPALPLACILEGGTWAAGRELAAERRAGGAPPLTIASDGTVF
jgi:hypothetical protein